MCLMGNVKGALSFLTVFQKGHFHTHGTCQGSPKQDGKIIGRKMRVFSLTTECHQTEKNRITQDKHGNNSRVKNQMSEVMYQLIYQTVTRSMCLL